MSFNYRIIRFCDTTCRNGYYYEVRRVYCDKFGQPKNYSDTASAICGDTLQECLSVAAQLLAGMAKPYLKEEDFGK